ncbi:hypothetical protein NFI96_024753 [Prochilodus magdalenae]|nr:hypothetical protein NFI96_024753 [Prochilodus magdalenae]
MGRTPTGPPQSRIKLFDLVTEALMCDGQSVFTLSPILLYLPFLHGPRCSPGLKWTFPWMLRMHECSVYTPHELKGRTDNRPEEIIGRPHSSVLNISNGGPWGTWGRKEMCPERSYAAGFSLKVEYPLSGDDSALNGILLYCVNTSKETSPPYEDYTTVHSDVGSEFENSEYFSWINTRYPPALGAGPGSLHVFLIPELVKL